jgi:hypothetical protein
VRLTPRAARTVDSTVLADRRGIGRLDVAGPLTAEEDAPPSGAPVDQEPVGFQKW